jgi:DNA invertase Pin-like site-specific DNA recombinase
MGKSHVEQASIDAIPPIRALQYVRASSENRQNSTENQSNAIRCYAEAHNMEIVKTYSDPDRASLGGLVER